MNNKSRDMKRLICILFFAPFILAGCQKDEAGPGDVKHGENFTLYTGERTYRDAVQAKSTNPGNPFEIKAVEFLKQQSGRDILKVTVDHPAGCDGTFAFYWDGA